MEVTGKIYAIDEVNPVSDTFKKRDLILEVAENPLYPEYVKFEALQDKVSLLDKFKEGQTVEISFNLRGRPYTNAQDITTYFNSLVIWKINAVEGVDEEPAGDGDDKPF